MSRYYNHEIIKIENEEKYYFIAGNYNDEGDGGLNYDEVIMISGPYKDFDKAVREMVNLCGNPGSIYGAYTKQENSLIVRVLKSQLGDKSFPVEKWFHCGESFSEVYCAMRDEMRDESRPDPMKM